MNAKINKTVLDDLYACYNRRDFVHPDPIEFLYNYNNVRDREVAGLVASSLAYGRVAQILKSVTGVLEKMGPSPFRFVATSTKYSLAHTFKGFQYRFTKQDELCALMLGMKKMIKRHGTIEGGMEAALISGDGTLPDAMQRFAAMLNIDAGCGRSSLVPRPAGGSACKRLYLFLRWMVRRDEIDPGGWRIISPSMLIVPLDTHMHRICTQLGLSERKQADLRTAMEITENFKIISPDDPVKYDFAITRLGIRRDADPQAFFNEYKKIAVAS